MAELLAAYVEGPRERRTDEAPDFAAWTEEERRHLLPLCQLSDRLRQSMPPMRPSAAFVRSLGQELSEQAQRQVALAKRIRRGLLIGAAALGSLLSIASIVGAILFIVTRWRARAQAVRVPSA